MAENQGAASVSSTDHDASSESILADLVNGTLNGGDSPVDIGSPREGNGFIGKPRRRSILSRSGIPKVKKSVSFCSMPEDRKVSNGKESL